MRTPEALAKRSESMKETCSHPLYREHMSEMRRLDWAEEHGIVAKDNEKDNWALDNGLTIIRLPESVLVDAGIDMTLEEVL